MSFVWSYSQLWNFKKVKFGHGNLNFLSILWFCCILPICWPIISNTFLKHEETYLFLRNQYILMWPYNFCGNRWHMYPDLTRIVSIQLNHSHVTPYFYNDGLVGLPERMSLNHENYSTYDGTSIFNVKLTQMVNVVFIHSCQLKHIVSFRCWYMLSAFL